MHEMPIGGAAVHGLVLGHGGDDDAVGKFQAAQTIGREHGRADGRVAGDARFLLEPALGGAQPLRIAQAQVLVAHALGAGEERVVELDHVEVEVLLDILEPGERVLRGRLQAQDFDAALVLILGEGGLEARLAVQVVGERNGAFHGQLGARADGEMGRRRSVAHEHDVLVIPFLAQHAREAEPGRAAQMAGVRHEPVATEVRLENVFAGRDRLFLRHGAEAVRVPRVLRAFDDESRRIGIELVGVRPDPALGRLLEDEREGVVEFLVRAEPDELAAAHVDVGLEGGSELVARLGVEPIRSDDEIVLLGECRSALELRLEAQLDAEFARALLQKEEELAAADAAETVAARDDLLVVADDGDVVPIGEVGADGVRALGIVLGEVGEGLVGEHHAPAERVVRLVALEDDDLVGRIAQLHGDGEVKPRRPAAQTRDLHPDLPRVERDRAKIRTGRNLFQA